MRRIQQLIARLGARGDARDRATMVSIRASGGRSRRQTRHPVRRFLDCVHERLPAVLTLGVATLIAGLLGHWVHRMRRRRVTGSAALLRRDRILEAIGAGAEQLLRSKDTGRLNEFIAALGRATGVSRVYVFENHCDADGVLTTRQRFEWAAPGVKPQMDMLQEAHFDSWGLARWRRVLSRGGAIMGNVSDFPASEWHILREEQAIRSVVAIPIFIGQEWWGFIGFDEIRYERRWSAAEIDALKTSAGLMAATIEQDRANQHMRQLERARAERQAAEEAEWQSQFLAEASRVFGSTLTYDTLFERLAQLAVPALADWCIVDVIDENHAIRRAAVTYAEERHAPVAMRMRRAAPSKDPPDAIMLALESGRARSIPRITDDIAGGLVDSPDSQVRPQSAVIVPLHAHDRVVGAMTLISVDATRYGPGDLAFADAVAERASLGLENARLYAEAQHATRVRDEMLAVVSHDLRNPLHTIALTAGVLEETASFEDEPRKQLEIIKRSIERADRLIDDLLNVARLEAGTFGLDKRRISSPDVALEALELHRSQTSEGGQELVNEVPDQLPEVMADRDRLLEVFGNLLGNAIKFTPEGGRITLGAEPTDHGVRFRVSDTGRGIPPDQLPRLFDPFWQATRKREGAGLGLAIARGIVQAHGGHIRAQSTEGKGTTISFTIPAAEAGPSSAGEQPHREAAD